MCCFSRRVEHVSKTRIFARSAGAGYELLVYAMSVAIEDDVAMVLPLPVQPGSAEDALRFVDLSSCPRFFAEVDVLFPDPTLSFAPQSLSRQGPVAKTLVVHDVGDFEASFVPKRDDFDRLDPRFRLPDGVWDALPQYSDFGFAVFKLKPKKVDAPAPGFFARLFGGAPAPAETPVVDRHPMAFEFPRRDPARLFFPTVHVHDGVVHPSARFDHTLYCQLDEDERTLEGWQRSPLSVEKGMWGKAKEWLRVHQHAHKRVLKGDLPNADQYV